MWNRGLRVGGQNQQPEECVGGSLQPSGKGLVKVVKKCLRECRGDVQVREQSREKPTAISHQCQPPAATGSPLPVSSLFSEALDLLVCRDDGPAEGDFSFLICLQSFNFSFMCIDVCLWATCIPSAHRGRKRTLDPLELEFPAPTWL